MSTEGAAREGRAFVRREDLKEQTINCYIDGKSDGMA